MKLWKKGYISDKIKTIDIGETVYKYIELMMQKSLTWNFLHSGHWVTRFLRASLSYICVFKYLIDVWLLKNEWHLH